MYIYEFEKGIIKTGIKDKIFKERSNLGKLLKVYNDKKHTKEELEPLYALVEIIKEYPNEDCIRKIVLTKDKKKISELEISGKYELADIHTVEAILEDNTPINCYCFDGLCSWVEEEYINEIDIKKKKSYYIALSY